MSALDILVVPSTNPEPFGRVLIEGMAVEKPIIATNHGAAREIINHGANGWLVAPNDARAMADARGDALNIDSNTRDLIARRAIVNVRENYTKALMSERTIRVYKEILSD